MSDDSGAAFSFTASTPPTVSVHRITPRLIQAVARLRQWVMFASIVLAIASLLGTAFAVFCFVVVILGDEPTLYGTLFTISYLMEAVAYVGGAVLLLVVCKRMYPFVYSGQPLELVEVMRAQRLTWAVGMPLVAMWMFGVALNRILELFFAHLNY